MPTRLAICGLLLLAAACASGNPRRSQLAPAPLPGKPAAEPEPAAPAPSKDAPAAEELAPRAAPQPVFTERLAGTHDADGLRLGDLCLLAGLPTVVERLLRRKPLEVAQCNGIIDVLPAARLFAGMMTDDAAD